MRLFSKIEPGLLLALLLSLFIITSLLPPGLPTVADLPLHLYRTMEYAEAWAPGVIVPRWAPNLAYGYGYPLFVFAPPLPYLGGLALHGLGLNWENAVKGLLILTILLYAGGMYLLARTLSGSAAAGLVAATAYTFAPFALREALLYGGNTPQFLAIALFPWVLWAMTGSAAHRSWGWVVLAAGFYAGIMTSHLFQVLIFTPVMGLYGLLLMSRAWQTPPAELPGLVKPAGRLPAVRRLVVAAQPLLVIPLGLLLSAFFWLPAFTERFYTRAQPEIYLEKSPFFVRYPHWTDLVAWIQPLDTRAANPYVPLTLGVVTLILAALGLVYAGVRGSQGAGEIKRHSPLLPCFPALLLFFALVAAAGTFMSLPLSRPAWETVSILQVAEFPWRMLSLSNLGLAVLAGFALLLLPPSWRRPAAAACVVVQLVAVAPYLYPVTGFARYDRATLADQVRYERRSQSIGTTTLGEYLPRTVDRPPKGSPLVAAFEAGENPERLDRASLPAGTTATRLEQTAVTHRYRLTSPVNFTLRFFQFVYPGWQARLEETGELLPSRPEGETGLLLVDVPAGQHTLVVHFGETPGRLLALALSAVTGLGLLAAGLWRLRAHFRSNFSLFPRREGGQGLRLNGSRTSFLIPVATLAIILGAFWLKPLLRPVFTLSSPPDRALPAQYPVDVAFESGIRLIGYDLSQAQVTPGDYLQVVLYWQTEVAPLTVNLQPFVHLDRLDTLTTVTGATNYTPGDATTETNMPTFHWDTLRYVRDEHDLYLPADLPPLAYAVRVGLIDPDRDNRLLALADGSGDTARLTTINVSPGRSEPVRPARPLAASLSDGRETVRLVGYEPASLADGRLNFGLAWQSDRKLAIDYTVFTQLLDQNGRLIAGYDRPPLDGAYPTSTWLPGQVIFDPRFIPVPNVPPGRYRLIVGLYEPATGQRLRAADGTDFVELSWITLDKP